MDKTHFRLNRRVTPEIKFMHLMEAFNEAQRNFMMAKRRGMTFRRDGTGQSRIFSIRWKNRN